MPKVTYKHSCLIQKKLANKSALPLLFFFGRARRSRVASISLFIWFYAKERPEIKKIIASGSI